MTKTTDINRNPPDPIEAIFDQAIKDGRREDVWKRWSALRALVGSLYVGPGRFQGLLHVLHESNRNLAKHPSIADLTPREYERLCNAVGALRHAALEFERAWEAVERNTSQTTTTPDLKP